MSAAALAALPLQTHRRLRRLVEAGEPADVFRAIVAGERVIDGVDDRVWRAWRDVGGLDDAMADRCAEHGISVVSMRDDAYPVCLADDREAPAVLFHRGDLTVLSRRRAGIIGTRTASLSGCNFARMLGRDLALNDVAVVSGLARGIDVHAHRGVCGESTGAAVAVVACGLDVVYPPEHGLEWDAVVDRGVLLSEAPPGTPPETHRFPLRNRILAALSEVLVVVESRARGGSMITVREALKRDVTVMAVPGAPFSPVSDGTNALLKDGCEPVTDVSDVLVALGLTTASCRRGADTREAPTADERGVLVACTARAVTVDEIVMTLGIPVFEAGVLLGRLETKGWVQQVNGWWEALT
ncbi:MAG: processing protein DprA [Actinomycetota bacterium]